MARTHQTGFLGWKDPRNKAHVRYQGEPVVTSFLPKSFDWRGSGYLVPIKDQGQCGSCWSFAITKSLEMSNIIYAQSETLNLSEQHMVSCARDAYGCSGGFMETAAFVVNKGLTGEKDFPYTASNSACKNNLPIRVKATSFVLLGSANKAPEVDAIKSAILRYGSVFVTVSAGGNGWSSGGDSVTGCRNRGTNHMINLVGWTANKEWIMANSWGTGWKQAGYAKSPFGCDSVAEEAGYIEIE
jgi:C1A family cysteine protease